MLSLGKLHILIYRETLTCVAELISKSRTRVPTPPIWIFHFVFGRAIFSKPCGYQFTKIGHALALHKLGWVYVERLWVYLNLYGALDAALKNNHL